MSSALDLTRICRKKVCAIFPKSTVPGQTYQVQTTLSLSQNSWRNVGNPFVAMGLTASFTDPNATGSQGFYRVIVLPPVNTAPLPADYEKRAIAPANAPFKIFIGKRGILPRGQ